MEGSSTSLHGYFVKSAKDFSHFVVVESFEDSRRPRLVRMKESRLACYARMKSVSRIFRHRSCIDARFRVFPPAYPGLHGNSRTLDGIKLNPRASGFIGKPSFNIPFALLLLLSSLVSYHCFKYEYKRTPVPLFLI